MKPRRTVTSNHVLSLPGGNEDNDLWVTVGPASPEDQSPVICSTWELSAEERERVAAGENVELIVFGTAHPPVQMRLTNVPIGGGVSRKEVVERLRDAGNGPLADLFETKTTVELAEEVETWGLPPDLHKEVLAFIKLIGEAEAKQPDEQLGDVLADQADTLAREDEWPYDDDPPDPL